MCIVSCCFPECLYSYSISYTILNMDHRFLLGTILFGSETCLFLANMCKVTGKCTFIFSTIPILCHILQPKMDATLV